MLTNPNDYIGYIAQTELDGVTKTFGLTADDRRRHVYMLGKSGMGKSTLLENMVLQDIYAGHGVCFIDPLGDSANSILDRIPNYRLKDVVYFNPGDHDHPIGMNLLEVKDGENVNLMASEIMSVMGRLWEGMWSARMEYILSNTILGLMDMRGQSMLGILKVFNNNDFMKEMTSTINNIVVREFWTREYIQFPPNYRAEAVASIQNKIGQLFANDILCNILGPVESTINFSDIMNNRKIFICNLAKGRIGEGNCNLLGSLIVSKLQLTAMARVDIPEEERADFFFYIDEFQNFINKSFITILSEARKYRLNLTVAHQYLGQIGGEEAEAIQQAIFGNVGTIISFSLGQSDAEVIGKELEFEEENYKYFKDLEKGQIIIKPTIRAKTLTAFYATTLPPLYQEFRGNLAKSIEVSRSLYSKPSKEVGDAIMRYYGVNPPGIPSVIPDKKKRVRKPNEESENTYQNNNSSNVGNKGGNSYVKKTPTSISN